MNANLFVLRSSFASIANIFVFLVLAYILSVDDFAQFQLFINAIVMLSTLSSLKLEESIFVGGQKNIRIFSFIYLGALLFIGGLFFLLNKFYWDSYDFVTRSIMVFFLSLLSQYFIILIGYIQLSTKKFTGYIALKLSLSASLLITFIVFYYSCGFTYEAVFISQILAAIFFMPVLARNMGNSIALTQYFSFLHTYKALIYINFPMSLFSLLMNFVLPLFIAEKYGFATAGLYIFADKIIDAPLNMIGNSLGKYIYATNTKKTNKELYLSIRTFATKLWLVMLLLLPICLLGGALASKYNSWELLGKWSEIGDFFVYLLAFKLVKLANMPFANLLTLIKRQAISLYVMLVFFVGRVLYMFFAPDDVITFIIGWSIIGSAYYIIHIMFVIGVIKLNSGSEKTIY